MNYYIHGLVPYGYHVVNVILHVTASVLFTCLCRHGVKLEPKMCLVAGVMFAAHPVHTEAVTESIFEWLTIDHG